MKATKTCDKVDSIMECLCLIGSIIFVILLLIHSKSKIRSIFFELKELSYSVSSETYDLKPIASTKPSPTVLKHIEDTRTDKERRIDECKIYSRQIGEEFDLDPNLILAVVEVESHYDSYICGNGTIGLMQVIPSCHKLTMNEYGYSVEDLYDPYKNMRVGAKYLSTLVHKYEDISFALVCYNKGEGGALSLGLTSTKYSNEVLNVYNRLTGGDI